MVWQSNLSEKLRGAGRVIIPSRLRSFLRRLHPRTKVEGRIFKYDRALLPNEYLAGLDSKSKDLQTAVAHTGLSIGYPAWNLLYYTLLCSLNPRQTEVVIVETGTNLGFSTIILAQALKDARRSGTVRTVDVDARAVERAKENIERAGLSRYVEFSVQDSVQYLSELARELEYIDFAFLDGSHEYDVVRKEFEIVHPLVVRSRGKVFFDNTSSGGVAQTLSYIRDSYGGNLIEFENSSWSPPGNAIWQPPSK